MTDYPDYPTQVAARRLALLRGEADYVARRDALNAALDATGLTAVQTAELRLINEELDALDASREQEARDEAYAESAEYDPRYDNPREW
jgi:hypothetical protein